MTILDDIAAERRRAHAKHKGTSMESYQADDLNRLAILDEEVGEVAKEFNEARHEGRPVDLDKLRKELVQTAAMAAAWADACDARVSFPPPKGALPIKPEGDPLIAVLVGCLIAAVVVACVMVAIL